MIIGLLLISILWILLFRYRKQKRAETENRDRGRDEGVDGGETNEGFGQGRDLVDEMAFEVSAQGDKPVEMEVQEIKAELVGADMDIRHELVARERVVELPVRGFERGL